MRNYHFPTRSWGYPLKYHNFLGVPPESLGNRGFLGFYHHRSVATGQLLKPQLALIHHRDAATVKTRILSKTWGTSDKDIIIQPPLPPPPPPQSKKRKLFGVIIIFLVFSEGTGGGGALLRICRRRHLLGSFHFKVLLYTQNT